MPRRAVRLLAILCLAQGACHQEPRLEAVHHGEQVVYGGAIVPLYREGLRWADAHAITDYRSTATAAITGDREAIRRFALFAGRMGAASSYAHGVALLDLLRACGDGVAHDAVRTIAPSDRAVVLGSLEFGRAYHHERTIAEQPIAATLPRTVAALAESPDAARAR